MRAFANEDHGDYPHSSFRVHHSSFRIFYRLASLLEHFAVPDKSRARVRRQLKVLRQLKTVSRTCFLTESAEHAARSIEDKLVQNFFAARFAGNHSFDVHRNYVDTIFRTSKR